jgi:hypothetical protein
VNVRVLEAMVLWVVVVQTAIAAALVLGALLGRLAWKS